MKTHYTKFSIIIFIISLFSFLSLKGQITIEGESGILNYTQYDFHTGPSQQRWNLFIGENENYMEISYDIDLQKNNCEQVIIKGVDQKYEEYILKTINNTTGGTVYTNFTCCRIYKKLSNTQYLPKWNIN